MFATEQRWFRVVTTDEKRADSTSCEHAVICDILTEEHRRGKSIGSVEGTGNTLNREQDVSG